MHRVNDGFDRVLPAAGAGATTPRAAPDRPDEQPQAVPVTCPVSGRIDQKSPATECLAALAATSANGCR